MSNRFQMFQTQQQLPQPVLPSEEMLVSTSGSGAKRVAELSPMVKVWFGAGREPVPRAGAWVVLPAGSSLCWLCLGKHRSGMAKDTHPLLRCLRVARGVAGGTVCLRAVMS